MTEGYLKQQLQADFDKATKRHIAKMKRLEANDRFFRYSFLIVGLFIGFVIGLVTAI